MHLMNCPVCGKRIPFNSSQCPECGFDLTEYTQDQSKSTPPKSRLIIAIITIIMIALGIVAVAITLWSNHRHKIDSPSAGEENTLNADSPNPTQIPLTAVTPSPVTTPGQTSSDISGPVGVYSGDDGDILVLNSDGLAYYYCYDIEFTELECPWEYKNSRLSVQFYKFHCVAYADIQTETFSEILLRADSQNWNAELFKRIDVSPDEYIKRNVESYNSSVSVNSDGTMSFSLGGLEFTVPKQFRDPPNSSRLGENAIVFIDNDIDSDFMSTLAFYQGSTVIEEDFPARFLKNAELKNKSNTSIAGIDAITYDVTGSLNTGFLSLTGIQESGTLTIVPSPDNGRYVYILMIQTPNRAIDNSEYFDEILTSCRED